MKSLLARYSPKPIQHRPTNYSRFATRLPLVTDSEASIVYANALLQSRGFKSTADPYSAITSSEPTLNQYGYPTTSFSILVSALSAGAAYTSSPVIGVWKCYFTGTASSVTINDSLNATISPVTYNAQTQESSFTITQNAGTNLIRLVFSNPSANFQNLQIYYPGHDKGDIYNKDFISSLKSFSLLRSNSTGATILSPTIAYTATSSSPIYGYVPETSTWLFSSHPIKKRESIAEYIALLNYTKKNGWLHLNPLLHEDTIATIVNYISTNLDTKLKCYIDFGENTYNSITNANKLIYKERYFSQYKIYAGNMPVGDKVTRFYYDTNISQYVLEFTNTVSGVNVRDKIFIKMNNVVINSTTHNYSGEHTVTQIVSPTKIAFDLSGPASFTEYVFSTSNTNIDHVRLNLNNNLTKREEWIKPALGDNYAISCNPEDHVVFMRLVIKDMRKLYNTAVQLNAQSRIIPVFVPPTYNETLQPYAEYCLSEYSSNDWLVYSILPQTLTFSSASTFTASTVDAVVSGYKTRINEIYEYYARMFSQLKQYNLKYVFCQIIMHVTTRSTAINTTLLNNFLLTDRIRIIILEHISNLLKLQPEYISIGNHNTTLVFTTSSLLSSLFLYNQNNELYPLIKAISDASYYNVNPPITQTLNTGKINLVKYSANFSYLYPTTFFYNDTEQVNLRGVSEFLSKIPFTIYSVKKQIVNLKINVFSEYVTDNFTRPEIKIYQNKNFIQQLSLSFIDTDEIPNSPTVEDYFLNKPTLPNTFQVTLLPGINVFEIEIIPNELFTTYNFKDVEIIPV